MEATGAGLAQVDLLEGDDVGGQLGDLLGRGPHDGAGGGGVGDVGAGQRAGGGAAVTGPGAGQAVLEVEAQDPDHACSSSKVRLTEFIQ